MFREWDPTEFGWLKREGCAIYYKDSFDLREIKTNVWLMRKKEKLGQEVRYLVKFLQYIDPSDRVFAEKLLKLYLYPKNAKS